MDKNSYHWILGAHWVLENPEEKENYYDVGGISTIDFIKAKLTLEEYRGFLKGNILKYTSRCSHKGFPKKDAGKLEDYSRWHKETYDDNA